MQTKLRLEVVPPDGRRALRLECSRRRLVAALAMCVAIITAVGAYGFMSIRHARARAGELRAVTDEQRRRLESIDAQATRLDRDFHALRKQNEQIRRLLGEGTPHRRLHPAGAVGAGLQPDARGPQSQRADENAFGRVSSRIDRLQHAYARARSDGTGLERIALRVLNMRRLEKIARARVLASIPSLNPAGRAGIASAFGWRVDPWPEFHSGVDLDANYADNVRAGAAGVVVSAAYDGGYGIKVDIDHGNGYHTWYCHLSRADVQAGQYVEKAQHIALVGSTGASTGPHLHYQIMLDGHAVDPVPYLYGVPARVLASIR